ncbi:trans-1,2-dihydrobenzene-1,2-diol dehydrogenase [Drosophila obscura]|uniref:trans-1,2-dihydrobenzene-1,2-diol dehydrogenase n=1 Tax=Drosophila obscura TaxID=7282 RepID=UPI000BA04828|nr:trans-1,2-dihydrobenzene-1,2-diol dehydrogenase [Drosophila obscura]
MLRLLQPIKLPSPKSCPRNYLHGLSTVRVKRSSRQQHASESRHCRGIHHIIRGSGSTNMCRPRPRLLHINRFNGGNDGSTGNNGNSDNSKNNSEDYKSQTDESRTLRWGIAPVSLMANDFATALSVLPPHRHEIVSCAAAYRSHALAFADKYEVRNVYTSFEDLARCPSVDVVYISPLNPLHCELCHLMLNHDKHVLCEKPICMSESKAEKLLRKAQARGLFLMEGMWPRCVPAYHYLRHQILRNRLGDVQNVHCTLGLPVSQSKLALYGGVTSDFGVYGIQLALWVYREVPEKVRATGKLNEENVDVVANIELAFSHNRWANIEVSAEEKLSNKAIIQGKEGCIKMANYWCPTRLITEDTDYEFPLPGGEEVITHYHNRLGMCYEAEEVRNCILNGSTQSELFNHNESRLLANLMDSIHAQLGVGRSTEVYTKFKLEHDSKNATEAATDRDTSETVNSKTKKKGAGS